MPDPLGTAALRAAALDAWTGSPTRLREDAAAEADLRRGGYRDRLWTELAQNAADAAGRAGIGGSLTVWTSRQAGADVLHVANTGAPLDAAGVAALAALRASDKTSGVGRYGVGFTAVTAVADHIVVASSAGAVRFSADDTRAALTAAGLDEPVDGIPVLRLVWPVDTAPAGDHDTEIRLTLRPDIDAGELLADLQSQAPDLLLELLDLSVITIGDGVTFERRTTPVTVADELADRAATPGHAVVTVDRHIAGRTWREIQAGPVRWLIETTGGVVTSAAPDVLRAPTPTDEELSLPARLIVTDAELGPDRRRLLPGHEVTGAAEHYPQLVAALPAEQRTTLVPAAGFPRSPVDERLRAAVLAALADQPWVPTVGETDLPGRAVLVLPGVTDELAELLADPVPELAIAALSGPAGHAALTAAGAGEIALPQLAHRLAGLDREPGWWHRLYTALVPLTAGADGADLLGDLPVPLADGRLVTGPRTTVIADDLPAEADLSGLPGLRLVDPRAAHDLLGRIGAQRVGARDLLAAPETAAAIEQMLDAALDGELDHPETDGPDGQGDAFGSGDLVPGPGAARALAGAVLGLVAATGADPADTELPPVLGALPLPDTDGQWRPADEQLVPGAPLTAVLVPDHPFATIDHTMVDAHGTAALRAIGAGWSIPVLRDEAPTGPDHDLDDEDTWWDGLTGDPETLIAARDLEMIDPDRWPAALELLAADPAAHRLLGDRDGYTAWWLRRHALIGGVPLGCHRGTDPTFAGLLDQLPISAPTAALAGVLATARVDDVVQARVLLTRLADAHRTPAPAVIAAAHTALAAALAGGRIDLADVAAPEKVRTLAGTVTGPGSALVIDRAHLAAVIPAERAVPVELAHAADLADLLDIDPASARISGTVASTGMVDRFDERAAAVSAALTLGITPPTGPVTVHDELVVRIDGLGDQPVTAAVPWWLDDGGAVHVTDSAAGWFAAVAGLAAGA